MVYLNFVWGVRQSSGELNTLTLTLNRTITDCAAKAADLGDT